MDTAAQPSAPSVLDRFRFPTPKLCPHETLALCYPHPSVPACLLSPWIWLLVSVDSISYKQTHTVLVLLWLACFQVQLHCSTGQHFLPFLRPSNISLYVYTAFCLSTHLSFRGFVHSAVSWVPPTFSLLGVTLLWTWCIDVCSSFPFYFFWGVIPEVEMPGHTAIFCLIFCGLASWFSQLLHLFTQYCSPGGFNSLPTWGPLLKDSSNFSCFCFSEWNHSFIHSRLIFTLNM